MFDLIGALSDGISSNFSHYIGYFPLGVIGVWRWSVWCAKKGISFFYKIPCGVYTATVSVVTPVYNEDPAIFLVALQSWKNNNPREIIAVIDYTDKNCIAVFEKFSQEFANAKMIITEKPGKRAALADGIKASKGKIIALVDSDTVWTNGFLKKILGPFEDKKVGGVAPRQDVMNADTLAKRFFRIHIYNRYGNDIIYQAAFGNALSCISGRTGIYRRKAIKRLTDELENEIFFGKKCISGDDKRLTNLIQRDGWKVKYVQDALVYTQGFPDIATYLKQQIRWTRNSWRSDVTSITKKWMWKNPFLAFHTVDRFVQPFTLLLGPMFLIIALYKGDWIFVSVLIAWWMVSRSIKILGHLRKHPRDLLIMPIYIIYTYVIAVIKIYTLITVGEQSWITRWNKDRLNQLGVIKKWLAYVATFGVVVMLFSLSFHVNVRMAGVKSFWEKRQDEIARQQKKLNKFEDQSIPMAVTNKQMQEREDWIMQEINDDSFAYYQTSLWEDVPDIKRRFFLAPDTTLYRDDGTALMDGVRLQNGETIKIPVSQLQDPHMQLYRETGAQNFIVTNDYEENAIRVRGNGAFVTIPQLARRLNDESFLHNIEDKTWILRRNLFIDDGVTLVISGQDVAWLKLKSEDQGFVWVKAENGNIIIENTKVTSWDEIKNNHDMNWQDGRSYILQKSNGRMDITDSELAYLGNYGFPLRGNPFGGPYGVSWKIQSASFHKEVSTGSVKNSRIHHNLFGMYSYGATGIVISHNEVYENVSYGIDPHDDSNHMLIADNNVHHNGNHGIIASKRCFANIIRGNYSHDNALHGIMLDRNSHHNIVERNYVSGNVNGITLYQSSNNIIRKNEVIDNNIGVRGNNASKNNYIGYNTIKINNKGVYFYQGSRDNYVGNNSFLFNKLNLHFKEKSQNFVK
ncbi:MAG: glycosyltransferase [Parcubacteria group bacterium]|jgi:hyaluronan synthase